MDETAWKQRIYTHCKNSYRTNCKNRSFCMNIIDIDLCNKNEKCEILTLDLDDITITKLQELSDASGESFEKTLKNTLISVFKKLEDEASVVK